MTAGPVVGPPLRVAVVGMEVRQVKTLELAFQGPCRDACMLVDEPQAQACIVDMDSYQASTALAELRRRDPLRPLILLSLAPLAPAVVASDLVLAKPISLDDLVARLGVLRERVRQAALAAAAAQREAATVPLADDASAMIVVAKRIDDWGRPAVAGDPQARSRVARLLDQEQANALIGTAPDIDPSDPHQLVKAYYDPSRFLQSIVIAARDSAHARGQGVRIQGPWPEIVLDPLRGLARIADADHRLRPYGLQPAALQQSRLEYIERLVLLHGQFRTVALDALIWKLALWAARGRLPLDTPVDVPVQLQRWPNFTRLTLAPGAMSIAALWAREPHSLIRTAEVLNLPQRSVFAFYSAAAALGLAQCRADAAPKALASNRPLDFAADARRGLLGRIMKRLNVFF
ncbi:hypothetical protein [uncultured Thiodictyon sp.]|uniref:hypothetical protein n=1 Tax=uncultured Thiodictyon sp. TaxID=1846217 RepID=UPI0025EB2FBE|nr:hypothetical protein [uncultured Thiodictyon sp.]